MRVAASMTPDPLTVSPETPLSVVRELLRERGCRHLPVVDAAGRLAGVVSDRDVRSALPSTVLDPVLEPAQAARLAQVTAAAVMGRPPVTIPLEATLDDALLLFDRHRVGALPVLDGSGRLAGILTTRDVLRAYRRLFGIGVAGSSLAEVLDDGRPGLLERIAAALEGGGIACTRLIRVEPCGDIPGVVYVRVQTYNAHAVHETLRAAGLATVAHAPPGGRP